MLDGAMLAAMPGGPERPTLQWANKRRPAAPESAARLTLELGPFRGGPATILTPASPGRCAPLRALHPLPSRGGLTAPDELYRGDNLEALGHLLGRFRGSVDLIYLDPPFCSQADYKRTIRLRSGDGRQPSFEHVQYTDTWADADYLQYMYERLALCHELLDERGALFLHCDWHQSHRLRCVLDELFGPENFQNEIVWHYYNKLQGNVGRFAANHDSILFYSKSPSFTFNRIRERRAEPVRQIKRVWSKDKRAIVNARDQDGKIAYVTATHKTIDDVWRVSMLQPADRREAVGYPTQKPEALLERIIAAASEPGALILDPFMGSGTTAAVAVKLGRRFIGVDRHDFAVYTTARRLLHARAAIERGGGVATIKNGLDEVARRARPDAGIRVYALDQRDAGDGREPASEARLAVSEGRLCIESFHPAALADALPQSPDDWRALVDAVFVDFDYDGLVLRAARVDAPQNRERVNGTYELPAQTGVIAVRIVDLLGDAWTGVFDPRDPARVGL
jgi:DNA modification methylase